jgi:adenine-specific DNA glycosylase
MDLGAIICRSRSPNCEICPLRRSCVFNKMTRQAPRRHLP